MTQENYISFEIAAEDLQAVKDAIQVIRTKLGAQLIQLNPDDRKSIIKMGDKSYSFVTKALEYMNTHADLVPGYIDVSEMEKDVSTVTMLRQLLQDLNPLVDGISDTLMLAGSEAMMTSLTYYNNVKVAAGSKVPGAETIYDDLKTRFPGRRKKATEVV